MATSYEQDYYTWTQEQARYLQQGHLDKLDLARNPGLKNPTVLADALEDAWDDGISGAVRETGLDADLFPDTNPYTLEQLLDQTFWPH